MCSIIMGYGFLSRAQKNSYFVQVVAGYEQCKADWISFDWLTVAWFGTFLSTLTE